ncbi:cystatin-A isoform X1 [Zootoca vivipara]|uniref:cystatin-A isoform X1 n=1 Tax=Zootoca vivipara TaxID=8524 RepID=UPI00293BAD8C|nr:cystatin-A isoform X1 [Zootoca vivipara]
MTPGGLSPVKLATPEIQAITDQVKCQLEAKVNQAFNLFKAIEFRTQVVAGTNYFIKVRGPFLVQYAEDKYAHLRVFQSLSNDGGNLTLHGYQLNHTRTDPITSF